MEIVMIQFLTKIHFISTFQFLLSSVISKYFILVIMLSRTFQVKEKVQVIDAVTSIWESAVNLSLFSVKVKRSDWPGIEIFSVPVNRKENAASWKIRKTHEHNYTCVISRRRISRKEKISFNCSRLHRDPMVFFEHAGSVKKGIFIINDPFVSQCTVRSVDKPQDTAGMRPLCSDSLYVKYSDLRNESQGDPRKQEPDELINFMIKDAETL